MQLEQGLIDLFSLEPVDEYLRNYSKKTIIFNEIIKERKEDVIKKGMKINIKNIKNFEISEDEYAEEENSKIQHD